MVKATSACVITKKKVREMKSYSATNQTINYIIP